jgi:hypothetical protein
MHSTSAVRFPVFVNGKDYTGSSPDIVKTPLLRAQILGRFREEVQAVRDALIIPLGDRATDAVKLLITQVAVDAVRCLLGFPHPSGANAHRKARFEQNRAELTHKLRAWFDAHPITDPLNAGSTVTLTDCQRSHRGQYAAR